MVSKNDSQPSIDTAALIKAQTDANRITEFTPGGNRFFGSVNAQGNFVPNTGGQDASFITESPGNAAMRTLNERLGIELGNTAGNRINQLPSDAIDFSNLPGITSGEDTADFERQIFESRKGLLDPVFEQDEERLRQRLANQGIGQENEAFRKELQRFETGKGETLSRLATEASIAGRAEESRVFGQDVTRRGIAANEIVGERSANLNEISNILGRSPQVQSPSFTSPGQVDVMGPQALQMSQQQMQQQQQNSMVSGLMGLGGTLGAAFMLR